MAQQNLFTEPKGMVSIQKHSGKNAKTTRKQFVWCRQISTQSLGATVQKNGKTPQT